MTRIKLRKNQQTAINAFTADMDKVIREITESLKKAFGHFRKGACGKNIQNVTLQLFDEWLIRNLLPKSKKLCNLL